MLDVDRQVYEELCLHIKVYQRLFLDEMGNRNIIVNASYRALATEKIA
jgi:hypothetical protein